MSHDPVGAPPHEGRDAIRQFLQGLAAGTERMSFQSDFTSIHGDSAAVKWTAQLQGKNGKPATAEGIDIVTFDDEGKIQLLKAYWNPGPVLAVLQG